MVFLDRFHRHASPQGFNPIDDRLRTGERCDARDVVCHGLTPYGHFIGLGLLPAGSIDNQMDLSIFHLIDNIRSSFSHLKYRLDRNAVVG